MKSFWSNILQTCLILLCITILLDVVRRSRFESQSIVLCYFQRMNDKVTWLEGIIEFIYRYIWCSNVCKQKRSTEGCSKFKSPETRQYILFLKLQQNEYSWINTLWCTLVQLLHYILKCIHLEWRWLFGPFRYMLIRTVFAYCLDY